MTLMVVCLFAFRASAQVANFSITPTPVNITVGQSFDVSVHVDMVSGTANAVGVHLLFDATRLQITNITRPSSGIFTLESVPLPAAPYTTANSTGHLVYEAGIPAGSIATDFDILTITFTNATPVVTGTSSLTLENSPGHRTRAVQSGIPLGGSLTNGSVNISNCTLPTAVISSNTGSAICNGQPVTIRLQSATGVSPYDLTINGTTYNDITVGSNIATVPFPTYSVFGPADGPDDPTTLNDGGIPVTTAVKIRSSQNGFIKGVRFFAGTSVSGTYRAMLRLYNAPSTLLADQVFPSVTANGWNEILFTTPVAVTANTTYVVLIHSTAGNYVAESNGLTSAITNGPLTIPADGTAGSGPNSIYYYGTNAAANNTFSIPPPSGFDVWGNYQSSNYFIDVVFTSNTNTFNLTSVTDGSGCAATGSPLQSLVVTSMDCSTLPVTLLNLSATPEGNKAIIRWTTTQEINNRGFHIERSTDNSAWATVGFVPGVGNTDNPTNYSHTDFNLESRRYFYRLKQVDFDDRFTYSATVSAVIGSRSEYSLGQNYPNPFNGQTTVQFVLPQRENVLLTLHDANGKLVKVLVNGSKDAGTHAINIQSGVLSRGTYYYKIVAGEFINMKKMVVN